MTSVGFALLLSALAGLSTTIGSVLALFVRKPGPRLMTLTLGFSGGVMILVSFVELLPGGIETIGFAPANLAFFGGMVIMFLVDALIPHDYMAEHHHTETGSSEDKALQSRLLKAGLFVALGLGIHNFPEGMASFATALSDPRLGIAIAIAIAIHNIPEGLAVSAPVYAATGSRSKAFWWSFLSGVAEPVGALLAAVVLMPFLNEAILGVLLSAVAGIMVFISIDELLPISRAYKEEHLSIVGIVAGMAVMSLSLWMLK
ncbi:MAG: zinc transporter ZupT [Chloroflexota bacterium]|nr:zinc transporter ZupT [Chloroflexota bacterium]